MLNRFFNLIRSLFTSKSIINEQMNESYNEEIKNREYNLKLFYEVVGENPLKQIDWIIENGFDEFNKWFSSYEDGSIDKRQSVDRYEQQGVVLVKYPQEIDCVFDNKDGTIKEHHRESMTYGYIKGTRTEKEIELLSTAAEPHNQTGRNCGTPFEDVYAIFKQQISYYNMQEVEIIENDLQSNLFKAIEYFSSCRKNIERWNSEVPAFIETLDECEVYIIAKLMAYLHITQIISTEAAFKSILNSKDYRMYSPANQLKSLVDLQEQIKSDCKELKTRYSHDYQTKNVVELRGGIGNKVIARYEETSPYGNLFS